MRLTKYTYNARAEYNRDERFGGAMRRFRAYGAQLARAQARARQLKAECAFVTDALEYLLLNIGGMQVYAQAASANLRGGKRFSWLLSARMDSWADSLLRAGDARLGVCEIVNSLRDLDEKQMLRADEIWNAPNILRMAAAREFSRAARSAIKTQSEWRRAEKWAEGASSVPADAVSPAFYEHALKLAADAEDADKRAKLLRRLALVGRDEADCVRISQETQSVEMMRLENLMAVCRALDDADWAEVFSRVSFTEQTLNADPSGVYPAMDEESREAVRREVAYMASRTGYPERTLASLAVEASNAEKGVCHYLYTDAGRAQLILKLDARVRGIRKLTPDPGGYGLMTLYIIIFAMLALIARSLSQSALITLAALPAVWMVAGLITRASLSRAIRPKPLLRLDMRSVPDDARTLVVIPALIPDPARGEALAMQLEAFGALDDNENVDFLLLGDFKDSKQQTDPRDEQVLERVRELTRGMNERAGRRKYFFLHRAREKNARDNIYMGRERKRGALMDLNLLLSGGENRFSAEGAAGDALKGRFRYVVTVDADTEMIPGTVEQLIGAIHHPLNRPKEDGSGYCVIQPRMELAAQMLNNRFSRLFAGAGGADTYLSCAPEIYQDACGRGIFSGKGIYDAREFYNRTRGAFDDNTILSHDLIEGIIAGAGFAGDIALYEGFPSGPDSYVKRLERWTRGDWQLIPYLFGRVPMKALDRFKIIDNLIRSLAYPSACALMILAAWLGSAASALIGLFCVFSPAVFARFRGVKSALGRLCMLPYISCACLGGAARAVYRMAFSHKKLLEWVTAADADAQPMGQNTAGIAFAILLTPALARPAFLPYALALACVFAFGRSIMVKFSADKGEAQFTSRQFGLLMELGRDIWRYFEKYVPLAGNGLPPDNVQLDPPVGAAMRTSPTNVGMYLVACVAAREMGLIDTGEMHARMRETVYALETLDKWKGLMYNWYDTNTLAPLSPRYVSSVDCGNLLASLILCRNAASDEPLKRRMAALENAMELRALYDPNRRLFRIGYDVEREKPSESYYDLLASEARILSFVAIAEKGVPVKHWARLGRPCARVKGGCALISWSGTMFEYMMPFLFMPSAAASLMGVSARGAIRAQMRLGAVNGRPWGVSECAYLAFDASLNYQYRAFGAPQLAISGESGGNVIAPYATFLALAGMPVQAVENLAELCAEGLRGEFGLYEAADYARADARETVFSFMTHHQGMSIAAVCNALTGDRLNGYFMAGARERALNVLNNEKPFARPRLLSPRPCAQPDAAFKAQRSTHNTARSAKASERMNGHLLFGAGACVYLFADGSGFYKRWGVYANAWHSDPFRYSETLMPEVYDETGRVCFPRAVFDAGSAVYMGKSEIATYEICALVSPETGAMTFRVKASACTGVPARVRAKQAFVVALSDEESIHSHPAFANLFVSGEKHSPGAWVFTRKRRRDEDTDFALTCAMYGGTLVMEGEHAHTRGDIRAYAPDRAPLRPECAIEAERALQAGETASIYFTVSLRAPGDETEDKPMHDAAFERALSLTRAQARTMLSFCGVMGAPYRLLDRAAASIVCARPMEISGAHRPRGDELWPLGISGEKPILLARVTGARKLDAARQMIRAHEFYRNAGLEVTLVIVCDSLNDYLTPLRDALEGILRASHLCQMYNAPGGAYLLDAAQLTEGMWALLKALSAVYVKDDFATDLRAQFANAPKEHKTVRARDMDKSLAPMPRERFNGFGGFSGGQYVIDVLPGRDAPAPWSNVLANPEFGALVTEKGGGFMWHDNSRMGRLTPFDNDIAREGWGARVYAVDDQGYIPLTPLNRPRGAYRVYHAPGETAFECVSGEERFRTTWHVDPEAPILCLTARVENTGAAERAYRLIAHVDWLMGVDVRDMRLTRTGVVNDACYACGRMEGVGFLAVKGGEKTICEPDLLPLPDDVSALAGSVIGALLRVPAGESAACTFMIGWAEREGDIRAITGAFSPEASYERMKAYWQKALNRVCVRTGDSARDLLVNSFFKYQALACRVFARTGLYQPGGAFGLRDQLQDMLCVLYIDPALVRAHLLNCAAHQFVSGDGMHWWHAPRHGVRTRITDDILFLPFVCAKYVMQTGDTGVLDELCPYLEDERIPDGREDWYGSARETAWKETLNAHCMAAFRRADMCGEHGLALMGAGDWNDGMNKIGCEGRGESVWLSEFLSYTARLYAQIAPPDDAEYLARLSQRMLEAVDNAGWDGNWYLRALDDCGRKVGSHECEECSIDLLTQAWAVLNDQDEARARAALNSVDALLIDREAGLIRLLDPPFTGKGPNPGYIAAYPPGVRENGGQYTHAACWLVAAYAKLGDAERAWEAFDMLLPLNRSETYEQALKYRGEPYAAAADISASYPRRGVAGWTWYTGAASWTVRVMLESIMGLTLEGGRARLNALLKEGETEAKVVIREGSAVYTLLSRAGVESASLDGQALEDGYVYLVDDGLEHEAIFPARAASRAKSDNSAP